MTVGPGLGDRVSGAHAVDGKAKPLPLAQRLGHVGEDVLGSGVFEAGKSVGGQVIEDTQIDLSV